MIDFKRLDHVLITIGPGQRDAARAFYSDVLKLREIPGEHPNGAIWFEIDGTELHLREEAGHQANSDRHPAYEVADLSAAERFLIQQNIAVSYSSGIEGKRRCFFRAPFGNRFELIEYKN